MWKYNGYGIAFDPKVEFTHLLDRDMLKMLLFLV